MHSILPERHTARPPTLLTTTSTLILPSLQTKYQQFLNDLVKQMRVVITAALGPPPSSRDAGGKRHNE